MTSEYIKHEIFLLEGDLERNIKANAHLIEDIAKLKALCLEAEKAELTPEYFEGYESSFDTILQCVFSKACKFSPELSEAWQEMANGLHKFQQALTNAGFKGHWAE